MAHEGDAEFWNAHAFWQAKLQVNGVDLGEVGRYLYVYLSSAVMHHNLQPEIAVEGLPGGTNPTASSMSSKRRAQGDVPTSSILSC